MEIRDRILALDVFRGLTIAGMIIVNNQGDWSHVYRPLRHAAWHGWYLADLVFPFFLFIMGVSLAVSLGKRMGDESVRTGLHGRILRRTLVLVALGLALNLIPAFDWTAFRIPGVLQRIGLCYLICALLYVHLGTRGFWIAALTLLAGYTLLMELVPVPGFGAGIWEPRANLPGYLDSLILGAHTYKHAPVRGFDPEGVLTTLPAAVSALAGVLAGEWLRSERTLGEKLRGLLSAALICLLAGTILDRWIPINKNLWTPSYTVFMTGMALFLLVFCLWLIGGKGMRRWSFPFEVLGLNAILAYLLSSALGKLMIAASWHLKEKIFSSFFLPIAGGEAASLLYALAYLLLWTGVCALLYRFRIFLKI